MTYKKKLLIVAICVLLVMCASVWMMMRPPALEVAKKKLNESKSYGEIKWVWQTYEERLGANAEWKSLFENKLLQTSLNANQRQDLGTWYKDLDHLQVVNVSAQPEGSSKPGTGMEERKSPSLEREKISPVDKSGKKRSSAELAALYNKLGDEKCAAFKAANSPHLYHIANEYYQQAASLTNSNPKLCD